jgi:hypothetical protein
MLQQKIRAVLDYGYAGMIYTTTKHYNSYLDKALNVSGYVHNNDGSNRSMELKNLQSYDRAKTQHFNNIDSWRYDEFNNYFHIKNNATAYSKNNGEYKLADDEIILYSDYLYYVNNNYEYDQLLQNGLTLKLRESNDPTAPVIKTLKVVGYIYSYNHMYVNENLKEELTNSSYYIFTEDGTESLYSAIYKDNICTIKQEFINNNSFYTNIYYYNGVRYQEE